MCIARRHRHGLQESPTCALCGVGTEEIDHLLLACPYSVEVWSLALRLPGLDDLLLLDMASFWVWWTTSRKRVAKTARRGFDSMVLLVGWELWKERNSRTFDAAARHPAVLLNSICVCVPVSLSVFW